MLKHSFLLQMWKKTVLYKIVKKNQEVLLFGFLMSVGLLSTLYVEYKFQYEQFKWLSWRVFVIAAAIVQYGALPHSFHKKYQKVLTSLFVVVCFLYVLNLLANLINVYHLERFPSLMEYCEQNEQTCDLIVQTFFRLKIYRFVSLTSYFFMYVIFLIIGLLFSQHVYKRVTKIWHKLPKIKLRRVRLKYVLLFYFLLVYILVQQLISVFSGVSKKVVKMYYTFNTPYEQRWEQVMGGRFSFGWMKTYADFVNAHSPESATLLIPDMVAPWEMEGNPNYLRWFIYPRKMVQTVGDDDVPDSADYALLTYGVFGYQKQTFPTYFISKAEIDEIIIINQNTLTVTRKQNLDYHPEDYQNVWGLIKLRR